MNLSEEQTQKIREHFKGLKTKSELLELLNYVKSVIYKSGAQPFILPQLNFYCNPNKHAERYIVFNIKKKSGGDRVIHAPNKGLMKIQECLKVIFECVVEVSSHAKGFVKGRSIVDNAKEHVGHKFVFNIDLKDFFPSIDQARIWKILQVPPFRLNEQSGRRILANIIAGLCCERMEVERLNEIGKWTKVVTSVLPQGAPTSPILSNIICSNLDYKLSCMAKRFEVNYTRYADDITFSCDKDIFSKNSGSFLKELKRNIKEERFRINSQKMRVQKSEYRQEVTGLVVNEFVNVPKRYLKQLRMWLYYWESYGYERMSYYFMPLYIKDKGYLVNGEIPDFESIIRGKLNYVRMVKGKDDSAYKKLLERFSKLTSQHELIDSILTIWENKGLEKTMEQFYS